MTNTQVPIVRLSRINLLALVDRVPEEDLGNRDALIRHAVRSELVNAGYSEKNLLIRTIDKGGRSEGGRTWRVVVTVNGAERVAEVTVTADEISAICFFGDVVGDFAEQALELLARSGEQIAVGSVDCRNDSRIDLWIIDRVSRETIWHAEPLATCPAVLQVIREELQRRSDRVRMIPNSLGLNP